MSFALLSTFSVLLGVIALAVTLWLLQRLRVQHREVEVLSTLFWQTAIEETRARVFTRRFRHWLAWLLLVTIASILWMLLAQPIRWSPDGTSHVVLLDWSEEDPQQRASDLEDAIEFVETLPENSREIIAVGNHLETLLAAGEPLELATIRANLQNSDPAPSGIRWAIDTLSFRADEQHPLAIHLVGSSEVPQWLVDTLPAHVNLYRLSGVTTSSNPDLITLGVADARSGRWEAVDVSIGFDADRDIDSSSIRISVDDQQVQQSLEQRSASEFEIHDVAANGSTLRVEWDNRTLGELTLPNRRPIQVAIEAGVPDTLRELIELDSACQIVAAGADVRVGFSADANFRLATDDEPAFSLQSEQADADQALQDLVSRLAIQQIDAMALAQSSGRVIDVQVETSNRRSIAIWTGLFTSTFDFAESRVCPILVHNSIRWLANQPPLIPWARRGDRLPVAAPEFDRATGTVAMTKDGRQIRTARLIDPIPQASDPAESPQPGLLTRIGWLTWLGWFVSVLLVGEWILYGRGRMP